MKNLEKLTGVKLLSKKEQQAVKGGLACWGDIFPCPDGEICVNRLCRPAN